MIKRKSLTVRCLDSNSNRGRLADKISKYLQSNVIEKKVQSGFERGAHNYDIPLY